MSDDDLTERLHGWGGESVPELDGAFANRLETDLRMKSLDPGSGKTGIASWLVRPAIILGLTAVAAVAVLVVGAIRDDGDDVFLVAAEGTSVSIPGSPTTTDGVAGLLLPNGSRVVVGPNGSAIVGGVVLEPGSSAEIVDGQLEVSNVPAITDGPTTSATNTSTAAPPTTASPTTTAPPTSAIPTTGPTTTPSTAAPTTTRPSTTRPSTTRPSTTRAPTTTTSPPTTAGERNLTVILEVGPIRNRQSVLSWQVTDADSVVTAEIAGWEVRIRRGDETRRVALLRDADARRLRVEVPALNVEYRVLARSGDGRIVGESEWVSPA